mmetsp:Transcript_19084/g.48825  ORF Transcript_19084/g.48825 Transcript_19084/m.48825 type:complete len:895 (-) Transcript_19084:1247-3931(-)
MEGAKGVRDVHPFALPKASGLKRILQLCAPDALFLYEQRRNKADLAPAIALTAADGDAVCSNAIKKHLEDGADEGKQDGLEKRSKDILKSLQADMDLNRVFMSGIVISKVLRYCYTACCINDDGLKQLREVSKRRPIILLPNHKSHVDYLLLSYICYGGGSRMPRICSGDNLKIPFVGWLFRGCGAFFIRRSFGDDMLYRDIVEEYVQSLLEKRETVEFFMEGGRSRSGKYLPPKLGMLDYAVRGVAKGRGEDALVVPVSISYDRVFEMDSLVRELLGMPKHKESLWRIARRAWMLVTGLHLGRIEVRISDPLSVRAYVESSDGRSETSEQYHPATKTLALAVEKGWEMSGVVLPVSFVALAFLVLESLQVKDLPQPVQGRHLLALAAYLAEVSCRLGVATRPITADELHRALHVMERAGMIATPRHAPHDDSDLVWKELVLPSLRDELISSQQGAWKSKECGQSLYDAVALSPVKLRERGLRRKVIKTLENYYVLRRTVISRASAYVYVNALLPRLAPFAILELVVQSQGVGNHKEALWKSCADSFSTMCNVMEADFPALQRRNLSMPETGGMLPRWARASDIEAEHTFFESIVERATGAGVLHANPGSSIRTSPHSASRLFGRALQLAVLPDLQTHILVGWMIAESAGSVSDDSEEEVEQSGEGRWMALSTDDIKKSVVKKSMSSPLAVGRSVLPPSTMEGAQSALESLKRSDFLQRISVRTTTPAGDSDEGSEGSSQRRDLSSAVASGRKVVSLRLQLKPELLLRIKRLASIRDSCIASLLRVSSPTASSSLLTPMLSPATSRKERKFNSPETPMEGARSATPHIDSSNLVQCTLSPSLFYENEETSSTSTTLLNISAVLTVVVGSLAAVRFAGTIKHTVQDLVAFLSKPE